jgi:molybdopterin molybdotransferase/putative molybdopterin biosynthesis protein
MRPDLKDIISKEEALNRIFSGWNPQAAQETVSITDAAGRILAQDQYARCNLPVVRASMMDGIAVKSERFAHGTPDTSGWRPGVDYIRADTGDDFDDAYDAVIAIENVTFLENGGITLPENINARAGFNVKPCGADVKEGSLLAKKGRLLQAQDLAAIAMGGIAEVPVFKKPGVAFLPTGTELIPVGQPLHRGQNYDTNSIMIRQMLLDMGAEPVMHPPVPDQPEKIQEAFDSLIAQADIVLIGAGTSKGSEDYSFRLLEEKGALLFHGVAAVPGRPMSAAIFGEKLVVNLSGPSFAAFYSMDWAVRAIVARFFGMTPPVREKITAVLTERLQMPPFFSLMASLRVEKTEDGRYLATPVVLRGPKAAGSAAALTADGIYITTPGERAREAGETIEIELLRNRSEI